MPQQKNKIKEPKIEKVQDILISREMKEQC